ncbi:hypothetical protein PG994_008973 [Apiospora phragmitis]|uniref:Senescence domain-containing protein n=1 Tax=Apiospora phragmitis TaxID=2905665 RepID=A0ABR1UHY5_9PEZI
MEQPEQSGHPSDTPATVRHRHSNETLRSAIDSTDDRTLPSPSSPHTPSDHVVSSSVPTLRFPRPIGNRQLTNWVSSSSPDIMRNRSQQDEVPLDSSIADLGFEVIGNDGELQSSYSEVHYDPQVHELADDVQSIADMTDTTGTDADTNEVDSDSSEDDEEESHSHSSHNNEGLTVVDSHVDNMVHMADQSLEHPTELFTSTDSLKSRSSSVSGDESLEAHRRKLKSQGRATGDADAAQEQTHKAGSDRTVYTTATDCLTELKELLNSWSKVATDAFHRMTTRQILTRLLIVLIASAVVPVISILKPNQSQTGVISTVPAASVSSLRLKTEEPVPTSAVAPSSMPTTTTNALQTTSSLGSIASMPFTRESDAIEDSEPAVALCSAEVYSRDAILIKVPQQVMSSWPAKQTVLVAISRGSNDLDPNSIGMSEVDEGLVIQVPLKEAYGILDVSIATTRKTKINETFHVNFGNNLLGGALDAGKQLVRGFAQKVVNTVNDTTAWVEEACTPVFDSVSKQASDTTTSDSVLVLQGLRDAGLAVIGAPARVSAQVIQKAKQVLAKDRVSERLFQVETEIVRQAHDVRDDLALGLLHAQLSTKLWWLSVQGKVEEHQEYTTAAKSYYHKKVDKAIEARRVRAEKTVEEIRARQKKKQKKGSKEGKRSFWELGERGL